MKNDGGITLPVLRSVLHHMLEDDVYVDRESFALLLEIQRIWRGLNKEIFAFCLTFYPYSMGKVEMLHGLGRKNEYLVIFCLIIAIFAHKSVRDI